MNRKVAWPDGSVSWYMVRPLANGNQYRYSLHLVGDDYQDRAGAARRIWRARALMRECVAAENAQLKRRTAAV